MASVFPTSSKLAYLRGEHDAADTYKIALFTSAASFSASTTAYSTTNETTGTGYTAGGVTLAGYATSTGSGKAFLDWTTDPQWTGATFSFQYAMIYNSTDANAVVAIYDFGSTQSVSAGTLTIVLPTADATNAALRLA